MKLWKIRPVQTILPACGAKTNELPDGHAMAVPTLPAPMLGVEGRGSLISTVVEQPYQQLVQALNSGFRARALRLTPTPPGGETEQPIPISGRSRWLPCGYLDRESESFGTFDFTSRRRRGRASSIAILQTSTASTPA